MFSWEFCEISIIMNKLFFFFFFFIFSLSFSIDKRSTLAIFFFFFEEELEAAPFAQVSSPVSAIQYNNYINKNTGRDEISKQRQNKMWKFLNNLNNQVTNCFIFYGPLKTNTFIRLSMLAVNPIKLGSSKLSTAFCDPFKRNIFLRLFKSWFCWL